MIEQNTLRRRGTGLIAADPATASPGFTLFAPLTGTGQVYLVDPNGVSVHRWPGPGALLNTWTRTGTRFSRTTGVSTGR